MALAIKQQANMTSFRGTPASDTTWEKIDFGKRDYHSLKIIVKQGSTADLEISTDGNETLMALPMPEAAQNPMVYTFKRLSFSRLFFRKTGAVIEGVAYDVE